MKSSSLCLLLLIASQNNSQAQTWNSNYFPPVAYITPCDSLYIFYPDDSLNIWQEGPSSTKFFFGLTGTEDAIMTDSLNAYASSNQSYFDLLLPGYDYNCANVEVRFLHKLEVDETKDGGFITWSTDDFTWYSLYQNGNYGVPQIGYQNLYFFNDTVEASNGYAGFTSLIDTFLETRVEFIRHPPERIGCEEKQQDVSDIFMRFNFVSDSIQTNKAGWVIKHLQVIGLNMGSLIASVDQTPLAISVFPNPTSANSSITYTLSTPATVSIVLYDVLGNKLQQLVTANQQQGEHTTTLDAHKLANGVYILQIRAGEEMASQKVVLLR